MGHELVSLPSRPLAGSPSRIGTRSLIAGVAAAVAAGVVPVAHADIELGAGFSITGFADMSYWSANPSGPDNTSKGLGIDQFETDFKFAGSNGISAQVDIEYGEGFEGSGDTTFVEQAFLTKSFNDQFSVKFGRFLSYTGWEAEEPTGLFQYSSVAAYTPYQQLFYGYYQQGISAKYDAGKFGFTASVIDNAFDPPSFNGSDDELNGVGKLGYELGVFVAPIEGLTAKLFYSSDKDAGLPIGGIGKKEVINFWASYAISGFTFAGEYNDADYDFDDGEGDVSGDAKGYLLLANYASGPAGITLRYHHVKGKEDGDSGLIGKGFTVSPSLKVGDNLLLVTEFRQDKYAGGDKVKAFGLEALFTF